MSLKSFADALPDYAKDLRLNLSSMLGDQTLGDPRKYGLLLACAHGSGYKHLVVATENEVAGKLSEEAATAARAAAAIMAMNNVYYRFIHLASNPEYGQMPAKLRMNVIGSPAAFTVTVAEAVAGSASAAETATAPTRANGLRRTAFISAPWGR